jgi:hypothetical protein
MSLVMTHHSELPDVWNASVCDSLYSWLTLLPLLRNTKTVPMTMCKSREIDSGANSNCFAVPHVFVAKPSCWFCVAKQRFSTTWHENIVIYLMVLRIIYYCNVWCRNMRA